MRSFLSGVSWNSFKIENMRLAKEASPKVIKKNLAILDEHYLVESEVWIYKEMICLQITLGELVDHRKSKRKKKEKDDGGKKKKQILQIALSIDDSLFFCNHRLSEFHRELFTQVFEASNIKPYELFGSPPYDLLNLYRQSRNSQKKLKIKLESLAFDNIIEETLSLEKNQVSKIFFEENNFPHIRKLHINEEIEYVEDEEEFEEIKDIQIEEVDLVIQGKSIFKYYTCLEEQKKMPQFPEWLMDCKNNGRTRLKYKA